MKKTERGLTVLCLTGLLLGLYRGKLALLDETSGNPVEVFPVRACMLPPADAKSLEAGIPLGSPEELARIMEDFLS